jgi:Domain of Unknown Function (DUF928)
VLLYFLKPMNYSTKLISGLLIVFSLTPMAALADDPDQAPASGRSSGGRGCGTTVSSTESPSANVPSLILLAPQADSPQTVSTRPQFAWFVRDAAPIAMEFRLYAQSIDNRYTLIKEIKDDSFKTAPGINLLTFAPTTPELPIGRYRWQVVLICDRNRPSSHLFATADVEIVKSSVDSPTPSQQIAKMTLNDTERQLLEKSEIHPIER